MNVITLKCEFFFAVFIFLFALTLEFLTPANTFCFCFVSTHSAFATGRQHTARLVLFE